jgi:hypothetical protein
MGLSRGCNGREPGRGRSAFRDFNAKAQRRQDRLSETLRLGVLALKKYLTADARHRSQRAATIRRRAGLCDSRAESAHEIDDQAYQQNQAKPAAANDGTAKVKPAAAKQEKKNNHE